MMQNDILIAGFGGQGIVTLGKLIAYSAMLEGREVCCWARYGGAMRGGTSFCTVIISSETIASPVVSTFDTVVAMNSPSLLSFQDQVKAEGRLFWDRSLIIEAPKREDVVKIAVDATALATELGNTRVANLIFLGAISAKLGIFNRDTAVTAMKRIFKNMTAEALKLNQRAMQKGVEL